MTARQTDKREIGGAQALEREKERSRERRLVKDYTEIQLGSNYTKEAHQKGTKFGKLRFCCENMLMPPVHMIRRLMCRLLTHYLFSFLCPDGLMQVEITMNAANFSLQSGVLHKEPDDAVLFCISSTIRKSVH